MLDDKEITSEERLHSSLVYGKEVHAIVKPIKKNRNMSIYETEPKEDAAIWQKLPALTPD
jgi:hypothetical protein